MRTNTEVIAILELRLYLGMSYGINAAYAALKGYSSFAVMKTCQQIVKKMRTAVKEAYLKDPALATSGVSLETLDKLLQDMLKTPKRRKCSMRI